MRTKITLLLLLLIPPFFGFAQTDSIAYTAGMSMEDGIYMSYADFINNKKIGKDQFNSKQNKDQLEFIAKELANETISVTIDDIERRFRSKEVWGYFQNNTFYINYKDDFYRVPVFGSISYLVAYVTVISPAFYDPRYALTSPASSSKELKEFLMNFYDGVLIEFKQQTAEELISRDQVLYDEYKKLSNKKKKDEIYRYIRRFNEAHPVYFLK
jgi:hypothetical protein